MRKVCRPGIPFINPDSQVSLATMYKLYIVSSGRTHTQRSKLGQCEVTSVIHQALLAQIFL